MSVEEELRPRRSLEEDGGWVTVEEGVEPPSPPTVSGGRRRRTRQREERRGDVRSKIDTAFNYAVLNY